MSAVKVTNRFKILLSYNRKMEKSEREKMLAGEPYTALDAELEALTLRAQELVYAFNYSKPAEVLLREEIIGKLFGAVGFGAVVKPPFYCDYGTHIYAGDKLFINYDCVILDCNEVFIGSNVMIAPKVQIYTATHPFDVELRRREIEMALPIKSATTFGSAAARSSVRAWKSVREPRLARAA
jgi:maltose O-acetyltransferase